MTKADASIKDLIGASAALRSEYANQVKSALFAVSEKNESMMFSLRALYIGYSSNPCANGKKLADQIEEMVKEQNRLTRARVLIEGLIHIAQLNPDDKMRIFDIYLKIADLLGSDGKVAATAAEAAVTQQREIAQMWINESINEQQTMQATHQEGDARK